MSFTFIETEDARAIAKIIGGEYDGKIIYLIDQDDSELPNDILQDTFMKQNKKFMSYKDVRKLLKAIREENEGELKKFFSNSKKEFQISDGKLQFLPSKIHDMNYRVMVGGPSGCGKSTWTAMFMKNFKIYYKGYDMFVLSRLNDDKVLDKQKPIRIELDEELVIDPIHPSEFEKSLVIFDDIDTLSNKMVLKQVKLLQDDLLECGRHQETHIICVSHQLLNYKSTRKMLLESTHIVVFPRSGNKYTITNLFKRYCGMDRHQIKKAMNLKSRWLCISRIHPVYIIHEKGIYILD